MRTAAPPPVERRETGLGNAGGGRRRSILLVDDDPAVRRTVQALFGREGHAVEVARNVTHAFELAAGQPFDLIIADARSAAR